MGSVLEKHKHSIDNLSAAGARWLFLPNDHRRAQLMASSLDIPLAIGLILDARGINLENAERFLTPKLKTEMPDPHDLIDMPEAVEVIVDALSHQKKIGIFGDYDVDGGTSSAIMYRLFKMLGQEALVHIPDRLKEGYGPNLQAFMGLKAKGAEIIITVDCGSAAPEIMQQAQAQGLTIIILDHHLTAGKTLGAESTVNPNRPDDMSGLGYLTAAGVCFLFAVALLRELSLKGFFQGGVSKPDLLSLLDLVALGTVCDVAPLVGLNRALVAQGLRVIESGQNIGIAHLGIVAQVTGRITAYHCGFVYGPRINAGGRVGRASAGFELLTTECSQTAKMLAEELDRYNLERKAIEDQVKEGVLAQIEAENLHQDAVIIAYDQDWHHGVVGIVASRIKDLYYKPCFILGGEGDSDLLKGSGRSISGVNIGAAVKEAVQQGILISGGGHKAAAGLTVHRDQIAQLRAFFDTYLGQDVADHGAYRISKIDATMSIRAVNFALFEALNKLAPFGIENPSPVICLENVTVTFHKVINDKHIRLKLTDQDHQHLTAICFNVMGTPLGDMLLRKNSQIDVIGSLKEDTYHHGNGVQFIIEDCRLHQFYEQ